MMLICIKTKFLNNLLFCLKVHVVRLAIGFRQAVVGLRSQARIIDSIHSTHWTKTVKGPADNQLAILQPLSLLHLHKMLTFNRTIVHPTCTTPGHLIAEAIQYQFCFTNLMVNHLSSSIK